MKQFHESSQLNIGTPYTRQAKAIRPSHQSSRIKVLKGRLNGLLTALLNALCGSDEPRIRQKIGRLGDRYYRVYDPAKNTHHLFSSEAALRIWLEQRYYQ